MGSIHGQEIDKKILRFSGLVFLVRELILLIWLLYQIRLNRHNYARQSDSLSS
ncbi:MAG: hypothetical protein F6K22_26795 [Okeania sp. SIO2F4]|uniref:hypothetical protein n=1 Tax=Okeania sp. SIO2F4 TaxID=2607790 RepID=UPI001428FA6B|nr:hypothetical protein [Okeania sp. SIO2F4]MDJ0517439.1 hypothetical protein [Trichodesmium sp. MO_231.B1]NES06098.1 hypothetical protein [Okeania sp. SIO2F4]